MTKERRAAILIGVLYIIGTAAGVAAAIIMPSFTEGGDILGRVAANRTEMIVGALLVLTMGFSLSALTAVFYPIGRRFSEALSMGYVIFRGAIEGTVYLIGVLIWLVLVTMSASPTAETVPIAGVMASAAGVLWDQVGVLPFLIGVLMFYWLLFRTRLVPRWLTVWGLAGAVFYLAAPLARMAGFDLGFMVIPLALQEMVLAVWLIAKGFNAEALELGPLGAAKPQTMSREARVLHPAPGA